MTGNGCCIYLAIPSFVASLIFLTVHEPQRLAPRAEGVHAPKDAGFLRQAITFMGFDAARAIHASGRVYYPMFAALALSAVETFGIMFWRTPYLMREFGWDARQIGDTIGTHRADRLDRRDDRRRGVRRVAGEALQGRQHPRRLHLLHAARPSSSLPPC